MKDSDVSRPSYVKAFALLEKYLDKKAPGGDDIRVALAVCAIHAKVIGTEANQETNRLVAGRIVGQKALNSK